VNIRRRRISGIIGACLIPVMYGLVGVASRAVAQTVAPPLVSRSTNTGASSAQAADAAYTELQRRVAAALHAQPYLEDRHIEVTAREGVVVLSGIVFSAWDLQDAVRVARKTSGARKVIDSLSIEEESRR
jgi:osmotically-inducible protein OsmY